MTHQLQEPIDPGFSEADLPSVMECLSFVTSRFFGPDGRCENPGLRCRRISETIRFLERNFEREESMMDAWRFPGAKHHKVAHKELLNHLYQLEHDLYCNNYDNTVLLKLITAWQKEHVSRFDEPLVRYVQEQRSKIGASQQNAISAK